MEEAAATADITALVNRFTALPDRQSDEAQAIANDFIALLLDDDIPPDDIFAKATVRYLHHREMWQPEWGAALMKFFGHSEFRSKLAPEDYRAQTDALIKRWFDYSMPGRATADAPAAKPKAKPRTKAKPKAKAAN